ncbi:Na+/H+ antiporter subunit E [Neoactinobaculum massilliense]|uniref:Na+/H+ antiporter subunit E n=1 Tax=Neoactinobaculum massilliense TaxID=2364794 RepID=UPI000F531EAB|nr:Na+/H+ antiporter subunit E [Neoactinobaculum massilliense]
MSSKFDAVRLATRRPSRFPKASLGSLLWLTAVWVLLWGQFTPANLAAGLLVALLVTTVSPFPATAYDGRFRVLGLARLVGVFLRDLTVASVEQAAFILTRKKPRGAVIRVQLRSESDVYLALTAGLSTLVPGTLVIDTDALSGTLYIHIFDVKMAGGASRAHQDVLDLEERVLRAFATDAELVRAGFVPGSLPSAGQLPTPFAPAPDHAEAVETVESVEHTEVADQTGAGDLAERAGKRAGAGARAGVRTGGTGAVERREAGDAERSTDASRASDVVQEGGAA